MHEFCFNTQRGIESLCSQEQLSAGAGEVFRSSLDLHQPCFQRSPVQYPPPWQFVVVELFFFYESTLVARLRACEQEVLPQRATNVIRAAAEGQSHPWKEARQRSTIVVLGNGECL